MVDFSRCICSVTLKLNWFFCFHIFTLVFMLVFVKSVSSAKFVERGLYRL